MASAEYEAFYQRMISRFQTGMNSYQAMQDIRAGFEQLLSGYPPDEDVAFEDFTIKQIQATRCAHSTADKTHVILFFHGGGYNAGSNVSHRDLMGRISKASQFPVIGIDYRLAPEHPYPAALEDAYNAYQYLLQNHQPSEIILAGASAGGGLILSLLLQLKEQRLPMPAGAVCICPWVDLAMTCRSIQTNDGKDIISKSRLESSVILYCGSQDTKDPFISPLYGDLSGLPPLMIQIGERELLLDEAKSLAKKAKEKGVKVDFEVWPEMCHTWHLFAREIPEGRQAIDKIGSWMRQKISLMSQ